MSELNTLQQKINSNAYAKLIAVIKEKIGSISQFVGPSHLFKFEVSAHATELPGGAISEVPVLVRIAGRDIIEVLSKTIAARDLSSYIEIETKEHLAEVENLKKQVQQLTEKLEEVTGLLNI